MTARRLLAAILLAAAAGCVSHPPTIAHVHIGHAVTGVHVTPGQKGYFQQAEERAREAAEKAQRREASEDLAEIKALAASIMQATESKEQFGLKHALVMAANHITFAATSPDASLNLQQSAPAFARDITRVVERCELIALLGKDVAASDVGGRGDGAGRGDPQARRREPGRRRHRRRRQGWAPPPPSIGVAQLRAQLDAMVARENPPYRTVEQWYLFNLVKLPNGRWVFDKLGRGGNIEGYQ